MLLRHVCARRRARDDGKDAATYVFVSHDCGWGWSGFSLFDGDESKSDKSGDDGAVVD